MSYSQRDSSVRWHFVLIQSYRKVEKNYIKKMYFSNIFQDMLKFFTISAVKR